MTRLRNVLVIWCLLFVPLAAHAYIGPGMGLGVIGVVLGILLAIVLAFFSILWYPVKRLLAKRRALKEQQSSDTEDKEKVPK